MALLWLAEFVLCGLAFYVLLLPAELDVQGFVQPVNRIATARQAILLATTIGLTSFCIGLYRPEICMRTRRLLSSTLVGGLVAFPAILFVCVVADIDLGFLLGRDALWPMKLLICWILLLASTRLGVRAVFRSGLLSRRIVVIGQPPMGDGVADALGSVRRGVFKVQAVIPADALPAAGMAAPDALTPEALRREGTWAVIHPGHTVLPGTLQAAIEESGARRFTYGEFSEQQLRRLDLVELRVGWLDGAPGLVCSRSAALVRRGGEIVVSLAILTFSLPVLMLAALAIRLDSPGSILYRQERIGLHGRRITVLKLRSMRSDAERHGPAWASARDPRITRVGALLRRSRVDELPQLINVLRGEMSFVGPRPEQPHFVDKLGLAIPFYADRALVKPGVTGWAQVNYPYGASIEDARQKLSFDLYYVKHRSLFLDLIILLATIRVILFQEGSR